MIKIPLSKGYFALISDCDKKRILQFKWHVQIKRSNYILVVRSVYSETGIQSVQKMSRFIMNITDKKMIVDHRNGNPLDNRRCNLRLTTSQQNSWNSKRPKNNKSGYKGVSFSSTMKKWRARIHVNKKEIPLGYFDSVIEAAIAYNKGALKYFGKYARVNLI